MDRHHPYQRFHVNPNMVNPTELSMHYPINSSQPQHEPQLPQYDLNFNLIDPNDAMNSASIVPILHQRQPLANFDPNLIQTSQNPLLWQPAIPLKPTARSPVVATNAVRAPPSAAAAAPSSSSAGPAPTTKSSRAGAGASSSTSRRKSTKAEAAASPGASALLAPDYTLNPAGPASSSDTDFRCSYCDKVYKGKHARSIWRRHLQDKHGIPLASQPRRTRWDNDANRPKSEEERRARTLDSKRRWARKNRAASAGGTPGRNGDGSIDGQDEGDWEDEGDELEDDSINGRSRSNSFQTAASRDGKNGLSRSESTPAFLDEKPPLDRMAMRASQSSILLSDYDSRHPLGHRDAISSGPLSSAIYTRPTVPSHHQMHQPQALVSPSASYYQAPLAAVHPSGGALSAPLFPPAGEAEYYRNDASTSIMQRLGQSVARPSSASAALPPPYGPTQSTSSASLAYYASRASPGRGSRNAIRREPKSPVRAESNTEDAAGVLLALKMASPSTSSVVQSPVSATRTGRFDDDDDDDDDDDEDEDAGDLSLEANEPFSAFMAKQSNRRQAMNDRIAGNGGGSRLVANGKGAAVASPSRELPSSPGSSGSSSRDDDWSSSARNDGEASSGTLVGSTSSTQLGKKRSAEDSPPYGSAQVLAGLSASARKMRPTGAPANGVGGRALGAGSSYHQYTSLTATPTPAMRIMMESSPAFGMGRDSLNGGRGAAEDEDGDLEDDDEGAARHGGSRTRRGTNDGSPIRGMRSSRHSGPIDDSSSSVPRSSHHHPYAHGYPSSASSARHYTSQPLHHHHPVGLTSDLGHFSLSTSSDPSHPSSSSSIPPHPSSSSTSFHLSTPGGVVANNDYYRLRGSSPPSHFGAGGAYLFSSPAHPGISKQLGLHAQPGPGVLFGGDTPGRPSNGSGVDLLDSASRSSGGKKGVRLVQEGGSRAVLKLDD